jgi:hypothetical protein
MSHWDMGESEDWRYVDKCIDCGQLVGSMFSTGGPRICFDCALSAPAPPVQRKCMRCAAELEKGSLCHGCETAIEAGRDRILRKYQPRLDAILRDMGKRLSRSEIE